ncbi:MAG TPA: hypothetical protein VFP50_05150 [Anaeromyxobacteraceae bacterium]|nr:hypothetical protein [Anaeromyxobacteraceae bacterium]
MTRPARRLAVATALALGLAAPFAFTGCNDKCPTENPGLANDPNAVPTCPNMAANTTVSVQLKICPSCNQTAPECTVIPPAGDRIIQLDAVVQACQSASSCPPSCLTNGVTCTFTAPGPGNYTILVSDPSSPTPVEKPFTVVATGGATSCGT